MNIESLVKIDSTFSESGFISKVDNTFVMLFTSIMFKDIDRVKHKLSNELSEFYKKVIDGLNSKKLIQMYDELNVKSTSILNIRELNDKYEIDVLLVSRYMDYLINEDTKKYVSGINDRRIEKKYYLTFEKSKNAKVEGSVITCTKCGANVDVNSNGICEYCHTPYETYKYDWILNKIKEGE